jgi:SAM-dependent methyltransferase
MVSYFKSHLKSVWVATDNRYREKILSLMEHNRRAKLLDLGCDDGVWTRKVAAAIGTGIVNVRGIDVIPKRYKKAIKAGIKVKDSDLNKRFPFPGNSFDVVHANQVIEHVWELDTFVSEIHRVLKKGGYAVICTENLASWHNIFSLLLGYQPFSLTNISFKGYIGNPLALHVNETGILPMASWHHSRVLAYAALKDIFIKHGFEVDTYVTVGYFPLSPGIASIMNRIDPVHGAFPLIKVRKT